jgi:hypothetical protein
MEPFRRRLPYPLGDIPMIGSPDRNRTYNKSACKALALPLSYRTIRAIALRHAQANDGTRSRSVAEGITHALRLADSDANHYITIAYTPFTKVETATNTALSRRLD